MTIDSLTISGLRGFATPQTLRLAVPNGPHGSGLTTLIGPNNAGKSTIVEAFRAFSGNQPPSFTEGRRNRAAGAAVSLRLVHSDGTTTELKTVGSGGSETEWLPAKPALNALVMPSRRYFNPYFGRSTYERATYAGQMGDASTRGGQLDAFGYRLFTIQKNRAGFDSVLARVIDPVPNWVIEQADSGQYYLKFSAGDLTHSSEGIGEGLVSLLVLVDALYDSKPGELIVIDEPELSLHPTYQRRMNELLKEYASDRQIVVSTHSPYFLDLPSLAAGAQIARVHFEKHGSEISQLRDDTASRLVALLGDTHNPHVLGLDAREAFFLDERVILVEGQDDVIHYARITRQLGVEVSGSFFGWGVGGADKMSLFAQVLSELGFIRVVGIVDSDRSATVPILNRQFPHYKFVAIPAKDVKTKKARPSVDAVEGLLDEKGTIRAQYADEVRSLLANLNSHLVSSNVAVT